MKKSPKIIFPRACRLLKDLDEAGFRQICECMNVRELRLKNKETFVRESDPCTCIGVVATGAVQLSRQQLDGSRAVLETISEPILEARIITPSESIGDVMRVVMDRRGFVEGTETIDAKRVMLHCKLPLNEILIDFHDTLKSISHGYASMDYEPAGYQVSDIVKMDILLNGETVDAFATMVHRDKARNRGIQMCKALADTIPPHQFKIPVQAAIGREIIAREDIRPFRKDVLAKLYGGDVTRKMKVLEKQKRGKARMKEFGHVNVPQSAFIAVLKGTIKEH